MLRRRSGVASQRGLAMHIHVYETSRIPLVSKQAMLVGQRGIIRASDVAKRTPRQG